MDVKTNDKHQHRLVFNKPLRILKSVKEQKLDFFMYPSDDMNYQKRKRFRFSDDTHIDYHKPTTRENIYAAIEKTSFKWSTNDLSMVIGTEFSLSKHGMLGDDGKILPSYKKQILDVTGYNEFKENLRKENPEHPIAKKVAKNPFLILLMEAMVEGKPFRFKVHMLCMSFDIES